MSTIIYDIQQKLLLICTDAQINKCANVQIDDLHFYI